MHLKSSTQHYKAPREDGEIYLSMSPSETQLAIDSNRESLETSLGELRRKAKYELFHAAVNHSALFDSAELDRADSPTSVSIANESADKPLIVTGHQPELVHPGVWFKYANASEIAKAVDGIAVNIIVDNDTIRSRTISLPSIQNQQVKKRRLHFDDGPARIPWEDTSIQNFDQLRSFCDEVCKELKLKESATPLLTTAWPEVIASTEQDMNLSDAFTAARRKIDHELGLQIYDIPISKVCQLPTFIDIAVRIFADLPRFRELYNKAIRDYRDANGIKSDTHPMTELEQDGEWIESPFWIWKKGEPTRRRLFARCLGSTLELSDRRENSVDLPCPRALPDQSALALSEVMHSTLRIRPRALITTMVARLLYSDLFIHGIGGAKYDEMTDQIIAEFFYVTPPKFLVATATLHLPLKQDESVQHDEDSNGLPELKRQLRRMHFNPEEFLTEQQLQNDRVRQLRDSKQRLINSQRSSTTAGLTRKERRARRASNHERYKKFQQVNAELCDVIADQISRTRRAIQSAKQSQRDAEITQSREYPYLLFPKSALQRLIPAN